MTNLQEDTDVSFPDGNAFIVAQNVFFRIHRSLVARHSPLLTEAFITSTERVGQCPVLRVTDTPYDMRQVLCVITAVYCRRQQKPADTAFSAPAARLRAGAKYKMEDLVDDPRARLRTLFPTSLAKWDENETEGRHGFENTDAIEALNLFREVGQLDMVPAAVYRCAQLDDAVLRAGTTRADGTPERLSTADIELVRQAKKRLRAHGAEMIEECREFEWSENCSYKWACDGCYDVVCELSILDEEGQELRDGDPLCRRYLDIVDEREDGREYRLREDFMDCMGACSNCIEPIREQFEEMRERVWADLPAIAGVEKEVGNQWGF
ncbi:hypothetical protein C8Q80DRAFT_1201674 [Daedaleopsis nitida]|nr:hypothetical protein C8Q80DRAFT_1201674 [Daedaleopsis nitida]